MVTSSKFTSYGLWTHLARIALASSGSTSAHSWAVVVVFSLLVGLAVGWVLGALLLMLEGRAASWA